jgi:hypothetical protein
MNAFEPIKDKNPDNDLTQLSGVKSRQSSANRKQVSTTQNNGGIKVKKRTT